MLFEHVVWDFHLKVYSLNFSVNYGWLILYYLFNGQIWILDLGFTNPSDLLLTRFKNNMAPL